MNNLKSIIISAFAFCISFSCMADITDCVDVVRSDEWSAMLKSLYAAKTKADRKEAMKWFKEADEIHQMKQLESSLKKFDKKKATAKECRVLTKQLYWALDGNFRREAMEIAEEGYKKKDPFCSNIYGVYCYLNGNLKKALDAFSTAASALYLPGVHNFAAMIAMAGNVENGTELARSYLELINTFDSNYLIDEYIYSREGQGRLYNWKAKREMIEGKFLRELYGNRLP